MSSDPPYEPFWPSGTLLEPGISMLSGGRLHEIHAAMEDWAASIAFAMTSRAAQKRAPLVLIRSPRRAALPLRPYGEGLHALGIDPARLLIVEASDDLALLRAGLEAARCPGISALVLETWGKLSAYDLVASRRLVLAAERSGVAIIMLRLEADPPASAAHTRWQVRSIASLAFGHAFDHPAGGKDAGITNHCGGIAAPARWPRWSAVASFMG